MVMLHIGCGQNYFDGWVNMDLEAAAADLRHDARQPLPFPNGSVDFIYNEHFIEHLTIQEGLFALKECHRVLRDGGVLRIATPDLTYTLLRYFFFWKHQDWIKRYGYDWLETRAEMINLCFRAWGHQHIYNYEELARRLRAVGFLNISRKRLGKSSYDILKHRETRKDSKLVVEAVK
jgi:predicted SAM-dependent methyltransferase